MYALEHRLAAAHTAPFADDVSTHSIDELDAQICSLSRTLNAETYRLLVLVRAFDERMGWAKWSFKNCAEWLAWRCGLSLSAAREKVRAAHALREMPAIAAAFESGRLSYSKVRALTRVVEWHDEQVLLQYALGVSAAQVEERCREIRNAQPESVSVARRAWESRTLSILRNAARGVMTLHVEVPLEEGELIAAAIERAAAAGEAATGIEFEGRTERVAETSANGWRAQQADALIAVAKAYLIGEGGEPSAEGFAGACARNGDGGAEDIERDGGEGCERNVEARDAPTVRHASSADRYQIILHVDDSALRGGLGRADLPIDTLRRLTCDGSVVTIVEDEHGTPLDAGRKRRTVSTALERALWSRDRGCTFPGCHRKHYVDAHHIRHWAAGGATSLENLTLLCSHHHRLLHEGGFGIRRDVDVALCFRRPDGRVIPRGGYRLEDMCDDDIGGDFAAGGIAHNAPPRNPSAEVREARGLYLVQRPEAARR